MDIKDIKKAMDDMPMGDGSAFAEISVGPAKHEQFLDRHYGKLAIGLGVCAAIVAGWIIYTGMNDSREKEAGAALIAAMPETESYSIGLNADGLKQVRDNYAQTRAAVTANYLQAIALWNDGKEKDGTEMMQQFIENAPTEEWKAQASVALACHHLSNGNKEAAEPLFRAVADAQDPTFSGFAMLCLGDIARGRNDEQTAGNYYRDVTVKFGDSAFGSKSLPVYRLRKELFGVQPPVHVAPAVQTDEPGSEMPKLPELEELQGK